MVYTVTLNPAVDYIVHTEGFRIGEIQRSKAESVYFGGKGINVSFILSELGIASTATGFIAGFTGKAIKDGIARENIKPDFVELPRGLSRINIKIRGGEETDINGSGPEVDENDIEKLIERLSNSRAGDIIVLAGSLPPSVSSKAYGNIMERLSGKEIKFFVDTFGEALLNALPYEPFLIKPNLEELEEIFATDIKALPDAAFYARRLQEMGAKNVALTLGGEGALLLDEKGEEHFIEAHKGRLVNSVGAGDSFLAGFIAGYLKEKDFRYALSLANIAGGATAFSEGLAKGEEILRFLEEKAIAF